MRTSSQPLLRPDFIWLMLAALLILGAGIGLRHPWPADEPRFALVAKTMWETGNYLFPHRGHELYPDKPPLFMWLQVLCFRITGNWNIAFLLPSLLAALGTIALTFDLALRLWGRRAAKVAAWMLLFTVQFTYQAKRAQIDPVLVFLVTLSCYAFLRHLLLSPNWRWYAAGYFFAGIGVITKGVGIIALLILVPFFLARRARATHLAAIKASAASWWMGVPWLLLALAIWLVPMLWAVWHSANPEHLEYARNILLKQTAQRYANPEHHFQPWWYFIKVILSAWLPLTLTLPWALPYTWHHLRHRRDARILLPLGWVLLVILLFSLSPGKRDMYILPALPMFCVALAPAFLLALRQPALQRLLFGFLILLSAVLTTIGVVTIGSEPAFELRQELARGLAADSDAHWWMIFTLGCISGMAAIIFKVRKSWVGLRVAFAAIWILGFGWWGYPLLDDANSARGIMQRAGQIIGPEAELGLVGWREQNLLQADRKVVEFGFRRPVNEQLRLGIAWLAADRQRRWIFADAEALDDCVAASEQVEVGTANRRQWVLFQYAHLETICQRY